MLLHLFFSDKFLPGFEEAGGFTASVSVKCTNETNELKNSKTVFFR
jgi:hypothetical protein